MARHRQDKSGSKPRRHAKGGEKRGGKRPHPDAAKLTGGAPTAEQVARGQGTAPMVGGAVGRTRARVPTEPGMHSLGGRFYLVGSHMAGGVGAARGTTVHVFGGGIAGRGIHVQEGARLVLDGDAIVRGEVTASDGGTIDVRSAYLGDTFVDDGEIAARTVDGVSTAHIALADRAVVSAIGGPPDKFVDQKRAADAVAHFLGGTHRVVAEERGEEGAALRDGTRDVQVDAFLRAEHPANDLKLQVVSWFEIADQLGAHGAAIDVVLDDDAIQAIIRAKSGDDGVDALDLVISLPFVVAAPMRRGLGPRFDTLGYSRVWLVDAEGWTVVLGEDPRTASPSR